MRSILILADWAWLEIVGLVVTTWILLIKGDTTYMIVLRERFDLDRCTFLLLTWDMIVILEYIYKILWVPLEGKMIIVDINRVVIRPYIGDGY